MTIFAFNLPAKPTCGSVKELTVDICHLATNFHCIFVIVLNKQRNSALIKNHITTHIRKIQNFVFSNICLLCYQERNIYQTLKY